MDKKIKLTPKQEMFCKEYLIDFNATQACIKAGYSRKSAEMIGFENLRKPYIQSYIQELKEKRNAKIEITQEKVVNELAKIAFANTTDILDISEGSVIIKDLSKIDTTCIAGAKEIFDKSGARLGVQVRLHDKQKALELLGKHLGIFTDKVEHSFDVELMDWLKGKAND